MRFFKFKNKDSDERTAEVSTTSIDNVVSADNSSPAPEQKDEQSSPEALGNVTDEEAGETQQGVLEIEAATQTWTRSNIILAYALIWMIFFIDSLQQGMAGALTPYVTSSFASHSLTAATSVMSSVIGGLGKLPLAKILDIWGRPQGFAISIFILVVGLIVMAACTNVQTFAAAQVFYWVGYNGMSYCLQIFIADTSALENRALMFAFVNSPFLATTWMGGPLATAFMNGPGFRWAFATFAIITPLASIPLLLLFAYNTRKAKKAGLLPQSEKTMTTREKFHHYSVEFDLIGLVLLVGGLALFLLPFSIYSYQALQWRSPLILGLLITGIVLIISFTLYEKYLAPKTLLPFHLMTDRTMIGGCATAGALFISFYIWDNFFTSFLQVVNGLSITQASYVSSIFAIGSCFFSLIVGFLVRWSGRFKWLALYFGMPVTFLGVGLMIHFRQPDVSIGYVIMCQILIAFAGGSLVICNQMAVMASVTHQYLAVAYALENMFANIGGGIGGSIASGVWTGIFPKKLAQYLPAESLPDLTKIYGDLEVQLSYPRGSPTRIAIEMAYCDAQRDMLIAAVAILIVPLISIALWRDIHLKDHKQVKGRVV